MRKSLGYLIISLSILLFANLAAAQSTCAVPVEYYLTDISGEPLNTSIDVELNFYLSGDGDALAVDCRTASEVPVSAGWMRLMLDACSLPPDDGSGCGTSSLQELFIASDTTGDTVHVGIRIADDPGELTPRIAIGAVPFAVRAGQAAHATHADTADDATTLDGLTVEEILFDALSELSCTPGQSIRWGETGWECAPGPVGGVEGDTVLYGSYEIRNSLDVTFLSGFTEITGTLSVLAAGLNALELPNLQIIGESLELYTMGTVSSLLLPALESVGTRLLVEGTTLSSVEFPLLASIGGDMNLNGNSALTSARFPVLESIGRDLQLNNNDLLDTYEFPELESISSRLSLSYNDGISLFTLSALQWVGGEIYIASNDSLTSFAYPHLDSIGERIDVQGNPALVTFDFSALTSVGTDLWVQNNPLLPVCLVDALIDQVESAGGVGGGLDRGGNREDCTCTEVDGETVASCP
jgi:hypothetical protein